MEFSVTRQFTQKIPERVSTTEQIKAGLERIKKAQEQVLLQLKKNHPDHSIDVRTNNQNLNIRKQQNYYLQKQLNVEREKSTQKSTLYRRRVIDLENSLAIHEQNEHKLLSQNKTLEEQFKNFKIRYSDLEADYDKLVSESEVSNKNIRNLEKQVADLVKRLQQQDVAKLRSQFASLTAERNTIMSQRVTLLKTNSKLQSQNIGLKQKLANMAAQRSNKESLLKNGPEGSLGVEDIATILNEIDKMNISHEYIYLTLKSNSKLPRAVIEKQNEYQNSLNKILQMLHFMQKGADNSNGNAIGYRFNHQQSFRQEIQRFEAQLGKKYRRDTAKYQSQKQQLQTKIRSRDKKISDLQQQNQQVQMKISQLRKQKSGLLQQITELSSQISAIKLQKQKQQDKKLQSANKKQQVRDQQYRGIILELNQQMEVIQRQKKELDEVVGKMAQNGSQLQAKAKKQIAELEQENKRLKMQYEGLRGKYQANLIQKQHIELRMQQGQNKNMSINKEIAREVIEKQKVMAELRKSKQQVEIREGQVHKYKLLAENTKKQAQKATNCYLVEMERLIKQGVELRAEMESVLQERQQLRQLRGQYGLLMKDNAMLGRKARYVNSQLDHLWMIKQVEYQNLNKVLADLKPL